MLATARTTPPPPATEGYLGLGIGVGALIPVGLRYAPAFVFGSGALGFRHGLAFSLIEQLGIEISQTYLRGNVNQTDRGFQVFIDLGLALRVTGVV